MLPLLLALMGCGGIISLPVVGKLSNGDTAQGGVSIDTATGQGKFSMTTLRGFQCSGSYNGYDSNPTITIPVTCNNRQSGIVIATRDASGVAGTAQAQLRNGMTGRFLFGNISAQQQADFLK